MHWLDEGWLRKADGRIDPRSGSCTSDYQRVLTSNRPEAEKPKRMHARRPMRGSKRGAAAKQILACHGSSVGSSSLQYDVVAE